MTDLFKMKFRKWLWKVLGLFGAKPKIVSTGKPGEFYIEALGQAVVLTKLDVRIWMFETKLVQHPGQLPKTWLLHRFKPVPYQKIVLQSIGPIAHPDVTWPLRDAPFRVRINDRLAIDTTVLGALGGVYFPQGWPVTEDDDVEFECPAGLPIRVSAHVRTRVGI